MARGFMVLIYINAKAMPQIPDFIIYFIINIMKFKPQLESGSQECREAAEIRKREQGYHQQ